MEIQQNPEWKDKVIQNCGSRKVLCWQPIDLAYLCHQGGASFGMKLARREAVHSEGILNQSLAQMYPL